MMNLKPYDAKLSAGNFNAKLASGALYLPKELVGQLKSIHIIYAEQFISVLSSQPSTVAAILEWDAAQMRTAIEGLFKIVRLELGYMLNQPVVEMVYGALPPLPDGKGVA